MMTAISRHGECAGNPVNLLVHRVTPMIFPLASDRADGVRPVRGLVWAVCLAAVLYIGLGVIFWLAI